MKVLCRRRFISGLGVASAGVGVGCGAGNDATSSDAQLATPSRLRVEEILLEYFGVSGLARALPLGLLYELQFGSSSDFRRDIMQAQLLFEPALSVQELVMKLRAQLVLDFSAKDIRVVDGWWLSVTEVRLCGWVVDLNLGR